MALTLRGNGQITSDNYTIDSDGDVTAVNAAVSGTLGVTGTTSMAGNLNINAQSSKISAANNHLILHDTAEADTGTNWWYMYRNGGDGKLRFFKESDKLVINSDGHVTTPSQPAFQAHDLVNGTNNIDLIYTTTRTNVGGHYSTSTGRFTAPVAGTYLFGFGNIANSGNGTYRYYLRKNGSNITQLRMDTNETGSAYGTNATFTMPLTCAINDYVNIYYIESNQGYSQEVGSGYPLFWGYLIG